MGPGQDLPAWGQRQNGGRRQNARDDGLAAVARRQIRSCAKPRLRLRAAGDCPASADAGGDRPPRRAEHRRLHLGLSRLAARRSRPQFRRAPRKRSTARDILFEPGLNEDLAATADLGRATGRNARRRPVRRRLRPLVWQGPGRRPLRRCLPPCQSRRHVAHRRRARPDGRRSHGQILDARRISPNSPSSM